MKSATIADSVFFLNFDERYLHLMHGTFCYTGS